ncbi:MAG: type II secretion system minor pseudopilin GspJ [Gammaproteobacteria bacterium]
MKPARLHRGFTLIELLVALFITAIIFAMGYGAITQALNDREAVKVRQDRLTSVQKTVGLLTQDFTQLVPRPVREQVGDGWQPAVRAEGGAASLVAFTRGGWANPAGIQRPTLQRVAYVLEDGTFRREHWSVLDATLASRIVRRDLLDRVDAVSFRFMDGARQWRTEWPPIQPNDPNTTLRMRPIAVEVTLELEDWGRLVRIIEVGG